MSAHQSTCKCDVHHRFPLEVYKDGLHMCRIESVYIISVASINCRPCIERNDHNALKLIANRHPIYLIESARVKLFTRIKIRLEHIKTTDHILILFVLINIVLTVVSDTRIP